MVDLYADMFDLAPVSLWLEDYSQLRLLFDHWRAEGVTDLRRHLQANPDRVIECMRRLKVLRVNQRTLSQFGARDLAHLSQSLHLILREDARGAFLDEMGQLWDGQLRLSTQTVNHTLDGRRLIMLLNASVLPGHEERWDRVLVSLEDISDRQRALEQAHGLFEHSPVSLWRMDLSAVRQLMQAQCPAERGEAGLQAARAALSRPEVLARCLEAMQVQDVNQRTLALLQAPDKPTLMAALPRLFNAPQAAVLRELLLGLWQGQAVQASELAVRALDGRTVHVLLQISLLPGHANDWAQALVSLTDITARKEAETNLAWVSSHDALTGLRNRSCFNDALARLDAMTDALTVVVIDLDGLKAVNDTQGHAAGDALLRRAGCLIAAVVQLLAARSALAARTGGDEFALLLPGTPEAEARRLLNHLEQALEADNAQHDEPVLLSIGLAERAVGESAEAAMLRADAAMYVDKRQRYAERGIDRRMP